MATATTAVVTSKSNLSKSLGSAEFLSDNFIAELAAELNAVELVKVASNVSIATGGTNVAHGLGRVPNAIVIVPRAGNVVFQSGAADATNIPLQAVTSATNVDVYAS